jgi:hypothetical protein
MEGHEQRRPARRNPPEGAEEAQVVQENTGQSEQHGAHDLLPRQAWQSASFQKASGTGSSAATANRADAPTITGSACATFRPAMKVPPQHIATASSLAYTASGWAVRRAAGREASGALSACRDMIELAF